jgi:hypothetical protein
MRDIAAADSIPELENVAIEWGGSFTHIHTAATLTKLAKLPGGASDAGRQLQQWLDSRWRELMTEADTRSLANVLWAWGRLGQPDQRLWADTLAELCMEQQHAANWSQRGGRNRAPTHCGRAPSCGARPQPSKQACCCKPSCTPRCLQQLHRNMWPTQPGRSASCSFALAWQSALQRCSSCWGQSSFGRWLCLATHRASPTQCSPWPAWRQF